MSCVVFTVFAKSVYTPPSLLAFQSPFPQLQAKLLIRRGLTDQLFLLILGVLALGGWQVQRRWQVVADRIQQRLHTLVLEGGAAKDRHKAEGQSALTDAFLQSRHIWGLTRFQVGLKCLFILFAGLLNQVLPVLLDQLLFFRVEGEEGWVIWNQKLMFPLKNRPNLAAFIFLTYLSPASMPSGISSLYSKLAPNSSPVQMMDLISTKS